MEKTKQAGGGGVDVENIFWGHPFGESSSHAVAVHFNLLWRYFQVDGRDSCLFTILPIGKRPGGEKTIKGYCILYPFLTPFSLLLLFL